MNAKNAIGFRVGQHFDEAMGFAQAFCAAIGHEWETAGAIFCAARFQLFLRLADPSDFRCGVNHPGNRVEVHVALLTGDQLGDGNALLRGFVRQHRTAYHVAHRVNVVGYRAALRVDLNEASGVELDADGIEI